MSHAGFRRLLSRWTSDSNFRSCGSRLMASSLSAGSLVGRSFSRDLAKIGNSRSGHAGRFHP